MLAENGGIDMTESTPGRVQTDRGPAQIALHLGGEIYRFALLPLAEFWWHSVDDQLRLWRAAPRTAGRGIRVLAPLLALDRRLPPSGRRGPYPVKLALYLIAAIIGWHLLTATASIEDLRAAGELVVVSRESPTTLLRDDQGTTGPEYDYLRSFADFLGVELRLDLRDNSREVHAAIARAEGHLGAAGMTYYPALLERGITSGPGYQEVDIQVVCRRNHGRQPRSVEDLVDADLAVVADSPYESRLFELQRRFPELSWESDENSEVDDLLELVWRKEIGCTIANSGAVNIKRRFYPELTVALTLTENVPLVWTLSPEWKILADSIEQWLQTIEQNGTLSILRDRHFKEQEFDYVDMRRFIRRIHSRLPRLEPLFRKYAAEFEIPWTLLAAQAYQESHWNRRAKSPTGVRGIMMLTLNTAREMGVESRLDVEQSIRGGARYLRSLEQRIPETVAGEDRWWFALAAYNVGMGHLQDARGLARKLELDPDDWRDMRGVLPLLAEKKYYRDLRYGRARGNEPVNYVQRIRNYRSILHAQLAQLRGTHGS